MKKILLIGILILIFLPMAFASDGGVKFENTTLWADVFNGTTYFNSTSANITIQNPLGETVVNNKEMVIDSNQSGLFRYFFIPQSQGNYYIKVQYYKGALFVIERGDSIEIRISEDEKVFPIAVVLFLSVLILLFGVGAFVSFKNKDTTLFYIGFIFLGCILFTLNFGAFLMMEFSVSQSYFAVMRSLFLISSVLSTVYLALGIVPIVLVMFFKVFKRMITGDKDE